MLRPLLGLGLSIGAALLACGGAVTSGESSGSSGGSSGSSGGTSGGTVSKEPPPNCAIQTKPGDRVCVPGLAIAGVPTDVEVDSQEGCLDCYSRLQECGVTVKGTEITLTIRTASCDQSKCAPVCGEIRETCTIRALDAGTYHVDIEGSLNPAFHGQTLVVAEDGTSADCTLPAHGASPPPLDPTKYSTVCMADADCTMIVTGNTCSSCGCPNTAIATSDEARYQADFRATTSQCEPTLPSPCPSCPADIAKCQITGDSLVGTCVPFTDP